MASPLSATIRLRASHNRYIQRARRGGSGGLIITAIAYKALISPEYLTRPGRATCALTWGVS